MPVKEFNKSIKAKLYDFTYTPFMSSMVIALIVLNHKYILIYMASFDLDKKLELLKNYDFSWHTQWFDIPCMQNIFAPILFGLFYTFVYPKISKIFYQYTLNEKKELKKVKQDIEELTPILEEDAKAIKSDNYEKTKKILELENQISSIEKQDLHAINIIENKYKEELRTINKKYEETIKQHENTIQKMNTQYINEKNDSNTKFNNEKNKLNETVQELNALQSENEKLREQLVSDRTSDKIDARTRILKYFYTSNYKANHPDTALDGVVKSTKIPRPKVSKIIDELIKDNILVKESGQLAITQDGNNYLVSKFDNE